MSQSVSYLVTYTRVYDDDDDADEQWSENQNENTEKPLCTFSYPSIPDQYHLYHHPYHTVTPLKNLKPLKFTNSIIITNNHDSGWVES